MEVSGKLHVPEAFSLGKLTQYSPIKKKKRVQIIKVTEKLSQK